MNKKGLIGGLVVLLFIAGAIAMVFVPGILEFKSKILESTIGGLKKNVAYYHVAFGAEMKYTISGATYYAKPFAIAIYPLIGALLLGIAAVMMAVPMFHRFRFLMTFLFLGAAAGAFFTLNMFVKGSSDVSEELAKLFADTVKYKMSTFQIIGGSMSGAGAFISLIFGFMSYNKRKKND